MEKFPLVSVLMTAYNREKYIGEAIESVLNSTFKDFELIIVDDQSKDKTVEVAKAYEAKDERVKVYLNEQNLGDYPNRNRAASLARGIYLKYVDADDKIYPLGLEIMVRSMEQFPNAALGIGNIKNETKMFPFVLTPKQSYHRYYFEKKRSFQAAPLSTIIRRDVFEAIGGFSGKRMVGDFEMWHLIGAKYPIVYMQGGLTWYRIHDQQEMKEGRTNIKFLYDYTKVSENMIRSLSPLEEKDNEIILRKVERTKARLVFSCFKRKQLENAWFIYHNEKYNIFKLIRNAFS